MTEEPVVRAAGSASVGVLGRVAGPPRTAAVLHAGRDAVYLDLDGACTGLLGTRAARVPCAIRTTLERLPEVAPDALATVEHGSVTLPGLQVHVTGIVDTTVPVLDPAVATQGSGRLSLLAGPPTRSVREQLPPDALAALLRSDPEAVPALLGRGPGLTPLGDDVLGGWLATAVATRHPGLEPVRSAVALTAVERTTTLSATLLACAARGEVLPELRDLLVGLGTGDATAVEESLDDLVGIGDTSGAGALLGAVTALQALPTPVTAGAGGAW